MKRSEEMASVCSISRSVLVPAVNEITKLRRKEIVGEELDPKKRNDNKSKFVSYTALTELDKQADIINRYPLSHPLSNNPSHRASIKHLLLKNIYKNERIKKKLEHHHTTKNKQRRTNRTTETNLEPPQKCAMLTPLVQGKVQYGMLKKAAHFDLIREELSDRNISFSAETGWMACLGLLKKDENDQKFFIQKKRSHKDYEDDEYLDI